MSMKTGNLKGRAKQPVDACATPSASASRCRLPNLVYIGDVPVEATYHGSALLHRLLSTFPADGLRILEGNAWQSKPSRRLQDVKYASLKIGSARLLNSRANSFYFPYIAKASASALRVGRIAPLLGDFSPEAVVTVVHGVSWITAAKWAQDRKLPLHLIVHDDWFSCSNFSPSLEAWFQERFAAIYRQAATRWCASSYMAQYYEKQIGVAANVLMPTRAKDAVVFRDAKVRDSLAEPGFTVAYGGTVTLAAYANAIHMLATSLEPLGGRVLLYTPLSDNQLRALSLDLPNIVHRGLVPSADFITQARAEADALFVPMSFEESQRKNMQVAFPSKFTDYTCVGLPLIVHGPDYCSAVRFAQEHAGLACIITTLEQTGFTQAIRELANSPKLRVDLAARAIEVGEACFSIEAGSQRFHDHIKRAALN